MKFIYMKIKEILIYIGIIILILTGGYLKKDEINIFEEYETYKKSQNDCLKVCENDCECNKFIHNNKTDECIILKNELAYDDKYDPNNGYKTYDMLDRNDINKNGYVKTIKGSFNKKEGERQCLIQGLKIANKHDVRSAGGGNKLLSFGWVGDDEKPVQWNNTSLHYSSSSTADVHCSKNNKQGCKLTSLKKNTKSCDRPTKQECEKIANIVNKNTRFQNLSAFDKNINYLPQGCVYYTDSLTTRDNRVLWNNYKGGKYHNNRENGEELCKNK